MHSLLISVHHTWKIIKTAERVSHQIANNKDTIFKIAKFLVSELYVTTIHKIFLHLQGSAVIQWYNAWLEIEGLQVWASPASLHCVLEQDTLIIA